MKRKNIEHSKHGASREASTQSQPNRRISKGLLLAALTASTLIGPSCSTGEVDVSDPTGQIIDGNSMNEAQATERVESLEEYSVNQLAGYILDSEHITFDEDYPRIRESMVWAHEKGVFPLVNPEGDINNDLDDVSANVPVQKPLLVLLALINDAGIDVKITSLSTSSEHGQGSHHYQGRAVDLSVPENPEVLMHFVNQLNGLGLINIDESFAPGNPGGYGLNEGQPSDATEGDHVHISVMSTEGWSEAELLDRDYQLFESEPAQFVANELGIGVGSYFNMTREQGDVLAENGGFEGDLASTELFTELFPPEVSNRAEAIESAAQSAGISPNFLATIATIESAGIQDAESSADAHGIVQVVPRYHRDRIDRITGVDFASGDEGDDDRREYLRDHPDETLAIGADFLSELLNSARQANPDLNPNHPAIYARAAAGYNGGPALVGQDFDSWPFESKLYANFVSAFDVDVSIAAKLHDLGLSSDEVAMSMQSDSIYWRMVAFRALGSKDDYQDYSDTYRLLETQHPGVDEESGVITNTQARTLYNLAIAGYESFDNDALEVTRGMSPAMTFWFGHGGFRLFNTSTANTDWARHLADIASAQN